MTSMVLITSGSHAAGIARQAGQPDPERYWLSGNQLYVEGVEQAALDAALATYDHAPVAELHDREEFKRLRAQAVAAIKVTTSAGHVFDGDEVSQGRMARALIGLQMAAPGSTVRWVLADNTVLQVGLEEMAEALTLAGLAQANVWVAE